MQKMKKKTTLPKQVSMESFSKSKRSILTCLFVDNLKIRVSLVTRCGRGAAFYVGGGTWLCRKPHMFSRKALGTRM